MNRKTRCDILGYKSLITAIAAAALCSFLSCGSTAETERVGTVSVQTAPAQKAADAEADTTQIVAAKTTEPEHPYYSGDGGKDKSLAILIPDGSGLAPEQNYLPALVQGVLVGDMAKYSAIRVLDRVSLDKVVAETESGIYQNEDDFIQFGKVANVNFVMTGSITKTSTGYNLRLNITDTRLGTTATSYSGACTVAELDNHIGIKKASLELLSVWGVRLTERAKRELGEADNKTVISGQMALAQGITSQRDGTVVEALSHYIQASNYDPSLVEAASRLNILWVNISSGNIGENVRNDLQWRDQWVARLKEAEDFYVKYMSDNIPYSIVYTTDIQQGQIDYQKRTVPLSITLGAYPDLTWFSTISKVMNIVGNGLVTTGRNNFWHIQWPSPYAPTNRHIFYYQIMPFIPYFNAYYVTVEIVNSEGTVIGSDTVSLPYGWEMRNYTGEAERRTYSNAHLWHPEVGFYFTKRDRFRIHPLETTREVIFPAVDPNAITDNLTIRISAIDGLPAEHVAAQRKINILSANEYTPQSVVGVQTFRVKFDGIARTVRNALFETYNYFEHIEEFSASVSLPGGYVLTRFNVIKFGTTELKGYGGGNIFIVPPTVTSITSVAGGLYNLIPSSVRTIEDSFGRNEMTLGGTPGRNPDGMYILGANVNVIVNEAYLSNNVLIGYTAAGKKQGFHYTVPAALPEGLSIWGSEVGKPHIKGFSEYISYYAPFTFDGYDRR